MGKSLRGKECGKGICQRKDGLYHARFVDKAGKRHEKYFQTIPEARNWIEQAKYADKHEDVFCPSDTTVDAWFSFWIENIVGDLAPNTLRNYRERYKQNIQPIIGKMLLSDVKPMHCKKVLLSMDADYAGSTIRQTYITMGTLFKAAKMNDLIAKHPMDGVRFTKPVRATDDIKFLTRDEQRVFLETAKRSRNYNQYALIFETGLRTGEMIGLTWDAIDFQNRTLTVNKTLEYRHKQHFWCAGPPKTQQSYRTIPLTDRAYEILKEINDNKNFLVQMINDLLDFSKIEANTMEYKDGDVDVNALIQEICAAENAHPRPSGIQIEFVEKLPQCRLMIDRVRFAQVINNLVKNALKFTEQGSVRIGYRRLSNDSFYFYVADTGCGIDEESRRAIFERFVKMNYNIRGTGLGLSITKSIVEHYGGGIGVESKKGEGSTFYFTLPASAEYKEYGKF